MRLNQEQQKRLEEAKERFAYLYLNTGADLDEARDMADTMWNYCNSDDCGFEGALIRLDCEGERYRDM